jgi:hypothetical protein
VTLKEALDHAAPKIAEAFADEPELEATVSHTLGMTYWYLGKFDAANPLLEKAYANRLRELGPDHPDTLTGLHDLAMLRWKQGKYKEAMDMCRLAFEKRQEVLGPEHEETLWAQLWLGLVLMDNEKFDESEACPFGATILGAVGSMLAEPRPQAPGAPLCLESDRQSIGKRGVSGGAARLNAKRNPVSRSPSSAADLASARSASIPGNGAFVTRRQHPQSRTPVQSSSRPRRRTRRLPLVLVRFVVPVRCENRRC